MRKLIPKKKNGNNSKAENFGPENIARAERKLVETIKREPTVSKVVKKAAFLADLITDEDRAANVTVLREAKGAIHHHYDPDSKGLVETPDHKTRLAAATLQLAYDEGTPVQRQVILTHKFDGADATIARIKSSPELLAAVKTLQGSGLEIEAGGEIIDVETEEAE